MEKLINDLLKIMELDDECNRISKSLGIDLRYNMDSIANITNFMYANLAESEIEDFLIKFMPHLSLNNKREIIKGTFGNCLNIYYGSEYDLITSKVEITCLKNLIDLKESTFLSSIIHYGKVAKEDTLRFIIEAAKDNILKLSFDKVLRMLDICLENDKCESFYINWLLDTIYVKINKGISLSKIKTRDREIVEIINKGKLRTGQVADFTIQEISG